MPLQIENTHSWSQERINRAWPSIHACLERLVEEFPDDLTTDYLVEEIVTGKVELWVISDDAEPNTCLVAVITREKLNEATGARSIEVAGLGGFALKGVPELIREIENWARERLGNIELKVIGRMGWRRLLEPLGYELQAVILAKRLGG